MLLTPTSARPWLGPGSRNRPWPGHGAMMIRRREALGVLYAAYGSWGRLALGALAWALGLAGALLVGRGIADGGAAQSAGIGLLVVATFLGGAVVATGSALARAIADWLTLATAVSADGGRADATPGPETARVHTQAVTADRTAGRGELWRLPLLPRALAAPVLAAAGIVLAVQALLGYGEASTPYAGGDVRGAWLARVLAAAVCLLTAALTASGLRRIRRARMHRVGHDGGGQPAAATGSLTPALGSGAIVVGGTRPPSGEAEGIPGWASPLSGSTTPPAEPSTDATPAATAAHSDTTSASSAASSDTMPAALAAPSDATSVSSDATSASSPAQSDATSASSGAESDTTSASSAAPSDTTPAATATPSNVTLPPLDLPSDAAPASPAPFDAQHHAGQVAPPAAAGNADAAGSPAHAGQAPAVPRVRLSDGRELAPGTTLVGRAPRPRPDERADAVLSVADERVSKTHLTVLLEAGRVVVVDRGSTNGTVVHAPDGGSRPLTPGEPAELADGDVVVLGATALTVGDPVEDVEHTVLRAR